eukprot:760911-Rhodomonas_salina.1
MEWERKVQCAVTVHTVEGHSGQRREYTVRGPPIVSWAEDDAAGTEQLPKLADLPASVLEMGLQRLNLVSHGELQELPEWLKELTGLKQLELLHQSSLNLKKLPFWIGETHGLCRLDMQQCSSLRELPASMGGMTGLQRLNLSRCSSLRVPSCYQHVVALFPRCSMLSCA